LKHKKHALKNQSFLVERLVALGRAGRRTLVNSSLCDFSGVFLVLVYFELLFSIEIVLEFGDKAIQFGYF